MNSTAVGSERHPTYDTSVATADLEADANIRKLNAFIKNRDNGPDLSDSIPDSAPQMQEMGESLFSLEHFRQLMGLFSFSSRFAKHGTAGDRWLGRSPVEYWRSHAFPRNAVL